MELEHSKISLTDAMLQGIGAWVMINKEDTWNVVELVGSLCAQLCSVSDSTA